MCLQKHVWVCALTYLNRQRWAQWDHLRDHRKAPVLLEILKSKKMVRHGTNPETPNIPDIPENQRKAYSFQPNAKEWRRGVSGVGRVVRHPTFASPLTKTLHPNLTNFGEKYVLAFVDRYNP